MLELGSAVKQIRLLKNLPRETVCANAGISMNALRHLEGGKGATIATLISVATILGKTDWLKSFNPQISINPLDKKMNRQRASRTITPKTSLDHRAISLKKYGLTVDDFIALHKAQEGMCGNEGCTIKLGLTDSNTQVDHCHRTGKIRALLCPGCNTALGMIKDDFDRALGLYEYLKKFST